MDKKNRVKLAVMAGACAACIMVPASMAFSEYSTELPVDNYYKDILEVVSDQSDIRVESDDIIIEDSVYIEDGDSYGDDIIVSDSGDSYTYEDIVISDSGYSSDSIQIVDDSSVNVVYSSDYYDPGTITSDVIITSPSVTTTAAASSNYESQGTVKAAMANVTGVSIENTGSDTESSNTEASVVDTVLKEINAKRKAAQIASLTADSTLNYVADQRAKEIAKKFSHTRPDGRESVTILNDYKVSFGKAGENIACCISTPEGVVAAWSNSAAHNRCMLNPDYSHAGLGRIVSDGCTYWVLLLTN